MAKREEYKAKPEAKRELKQGAKLEVTSPRSKITRRQLLTSGAVLAGGAALGRWLPRRSKEPETPVTHEVRLPGNKRINVLFHFSDDTSPDDAAKIEPLLQKFKPHVVCIETSGTSEQEALAIEDSFAQGNPKEYTEYRMVFNELIKRYKPRIFALERLDKKEAASIEMDRMAVQGSALAAEGAFYDGNPDKAIANFYHTLIIDRQVNATREARAKEAISDLHRHLASRFPELNHEKELRVLVQYTKMHTPIYKHAKTVGFGNVRRVMETPTYFDLPHKLMREYTFGKRDVNQELTQEEVAQNLLGALLTNHALSLDANNSNSAAFGNLLSHKITVDQFNRICKKFSEVNQRHGAAKGMQAALGKEGIHLPMTKEEVHAWLKKRKVPLAI